MRFSSRIYLFLFIPILLPSCNSGPELLSPSQDMVISNNMPVLSWSEVDCDGYEIWIDGIKMESLSSDVTSYVPFPLSFGRHEWVVKAVSDNDEAVSGKGVFVVEDKTLNRLPSSAQLLREGWFVASSLQTGLSGKELSSAELSGDCWSRTSVPATVLTALVRNGIYPNPYVGMNNMMIPDSDDQYNKENDLIGYSHIKGVNPWKDPYWFVTAFRYGKQPDGKVMLTFEELNYKADIWLNGNKIAGLDSVTGMERAYRFDVTGYLNYGSDNRLAVAIHPVDVPGKPAPDPITPLCDPGCNMGDGMIGRNYTKWDTMGWDWQPPVRDRDMGITEEVYLSVENDVVIDNVYVTSDLPLPSTAFADITVSADIVNTSDRQQSGILKVKISGNHGVEVELPYDVAAGQTESVIVSPDQFSQLRIENPELWWPHDYGTPYLYDLKLTACGNDGLNIVHQEHFGIREVETYIGKDERIFKINGRKIYLKGGNWVIDMMLNWNASRYEKEILHTRNAGMNILRVWGPTGVAPKVFFDAADRHGVLMWQDFLNDFWGTFKNTPGYQPEIGLYKEITSEIVKKYRNHPSLILWCGGNEGVNPRESMITGEILPEHDSRDSRYYLKQSDGDGLHGGGPYHTLQPQEYFTHPKLHGFSSEIGPSGIPVEESLDKFMLRQQGKSAEGRFPLDAMWAFHDANNWPGEDTRKFTSYDDMLRDWYGAPEQGQTREAFEDYVSKAQLINYDVYRASIESINRLLWDRGSGILLWKSNSSWPSAVWQIYDWYLQAHSGYYSAKKASSHVYVQWNRDKNGISVLNLNESELADALVQVTYHDMKGNVSNTVEETLTVGPDSVCEADTRVSLPETAGFVKLELMDADGELLADNIYWIDDDNDFKGLASMKAPVLETKILQKADIGDMVAYKVSVRNTSPSVALMTELKLAGKNSDCELLPSFWSDNYLILMPEDEKVVDVRIFKEDIIEEPVLRVRTLSEDRSWKTIN